MDNGSTGLEPEQASFVKVADAVPPSVVSEAVRLTDKKALLYPWEKGRLGRIFGDQGRLSLKQPRLHPGANNFVKVDIAVSDGMHMASAVSVQPEARDRAIYMLSRTS